MKYNDMELKNVHVAIGVGLIYGVGVVSGWLLTIWGIFT
jgi:hypothetical protein